MPKPLIVANWKMHKTVPEALDMVQELFREIGNAPDDVDVVLAPPFTALYSVGRALRGTGISLASQNMFWEEDGAYTGEISAGMLRDLGCRFVILGHSERRQYFGDGDGEVGRKVNTAVREGLIPILCVGETLGEREYGKTLDVIERQVRGGTHGTVLDSGSELVIAYEPIWAIGTGKTSFPETAQEVHSFIRGILANIFGDDTAGDIRILYGGSVKPDNIDKLMDMPDINGALVGGAGLKADSFARIIRFNAK
ncbi:MAG: triose-phosphate isomerase [Deltaproteobacteria bacterium]|nr:triose-phosphate isomerase [Deltaproteobacteria bacterium]